MIHNQLSRLTEVQRGAKVAFGLDSGAGGLERLSESIQVVKDLWAYPEDAFGRGARICEGVGVLVAGGAGNYSAAAFSIQDPGYIAHLISATACSPTAGQLIVARGIPFPTSSAFKVYRDMRATAGAPVGRISIINNVAAAPGGTVCENRRIGAGAELLFPLDWVLVSGGQVATETACIIYHATVNVQLEVNFKWVERQLLPGELYR